VVTGAIRDITERKQAEEALREEAAISAALVQVGQGLIASLDTPKILDRLCQLTTEVLDCDCSYTALWHAEERVYKAVAAYGNTPEQWEAIRTLHVPPMAVSDVLARLERERVIEIGKEDSQQLLPQSLLRQFGMTAVLYLALWRGAELVGIQSAGYRGRREFSPRQKRIAQGISQLASLVLANAKLLEEIEGANRIKEDFIGTMSHELRTPLNVIIGYTDLLLEGEFGALSSEQTNILKRVDKSSRELLDLVGATLDLSRLQSRQDVSVHMQEVNVTALLEELEGETLRLNDKPTVILHWQIPQELPMLLTDPVKLKMVLKNLVTNALKFTQEGAVTVVARLQDEGVEFSVMDTGIGIAPENLQSIFDPFHQLNGSSTRRHGGVGLGLYIVRQLLKLLGGTISVESEVGRGSTFRVWVPRRQ
jgi:signal transduction histidine kinase